MKILLSTVVLLCAVSLNSFQASHSNPYEISEGSTRQNRCIRMITEIPVDMSSLVNPRQNCSYFNAGGESKTAENPLASSAKKSATEEAILQLIIALTKNLKAVASIDDSVFASDNATYLSDPDYDGTELENNVFGVISLEEGAVKAAREEAAAKVKAATEALEAEEKAKKALDEAKKKSATEGEIKEREEKAAAAKEASLRSSGEAVLAVRTANSAAAEAVAASHPAFTYKDPPLRSTADIAYNRVSETRFARLGDTAKTEQLQGKTSEFMKQPQANNLLSTDVAKADSLLKTLRSTGATYDDIRKNLGSLPISPEVRRVAFWALPPAVVE